MAIFHDTSPALSESIWRSPLLPPALAISLGIVCDRLYSIPITVALFGIIAGAVGFGLHAASRISLAYLLLAIFAFGACYHQYRRELCWPDDIGFVAHEKARAVRLVGIVEEEPRRLPAPRDDKNLRTQAASPHGVTILRCLSLVDGEQPPQQVSGRVRLLLYAAPGQSLEQILPGISIGDQLEVRGLLSAITEPSNPGEFDARQLFQDRGVRAALRLSDARGQVTLVARGGFSVERSLGQLRSSCHARLDAIFAESSTNALARAILLGEGAPLTNEDRGKYVRTGILHVIAISGQHLVIVAMLLWSFCRLIGLRQRRAIWLVLAILFFYALLTGSRSSVIRAVVVAILVDMGLVLIRRVPPANVLALAWFVVVLLDPTAIFDPGCQLSFLPFVFLDWAVPWLFPEREEDPLDELLFDSLPLWQQWLRSMGWEIGRAYLINLLVWVGIAPLVAYHSNLVPPAAILLAPPLTLLASIALFFGFLVLLLGSWAGPLAWPVLWSLGLCEWLIDVVDTRTEPIWVGSVSGLWLTVGYVGIIALVTHENLRTRWRLAIVPLLGWLCLPMMLSGSLVPGELRCTFLAVGHGGCAVIELPDGKVILYDAGSMRGPEVGSRVIVPYLWSRGIRRVDEVILSHADLDHYNALIEVAERITIGRVLTGEMFEQRERAAVVATLAMLKRRGIPHEIIAAGDRIGPMEYGLSVIHPPREFRAETENARSVVLEIEHHKQVLLLSGDLEAEGLARVLKLQPRRVDILQAPHHGSHRVDTKGLKNWCRGLRFVVSCQGEPRSALQGPGMYAGTRFVTTHEFGAVTVRLTARGTVIDVHRKMRDLLLIEATQDEGER